MSRRCDIFRRFLQTASYAFQQIISAGIKHIWQEQKKIKIRIERKETNLLSTNPIAMTANRLTSWLGSAATLANNLRTTSALPEPAYAIASVHTAVERSIAFDLCSISWATHGSASSWRPK